MKNNKVYFVAGHTVGKGYFSTAAYFRQYEDSDVEYTRFYTFSQERWGGIDFKYDIVGITHATIDNNFTWVLLSKRGTVILFSQFSTVETTIPVAETGEGKLTRFNDITAIGNDIYVCGLRRQTYNTIYTLDLYQLLFTM